MTAALLPGPARADGPVDEAFAAAAGIVQDAPGIDNGTREFLLDALEWLHVCVGNGSPGNHTPCGNATFDFAFELLDLAMLRYEIYPDPLHFDLTVGSPMPPVQSRGFRICISNEPGGCHSGGMG